MTNRQPHKIQRFVAIALSLVLLSGCAAQPGPAPVVEPSPEPAPHQSVEETTSVAPQEESGAGRSQISAGVEPLRNGLNPHLISDNNPTVEAIVDLVLPSVFINGELNTDLVISAEEVPPAHDAAMTVRYEIDPTAQWSDGTPITGADFLYLWQGMTRTPAVLNGAGYRLISNIRTSDAGRTVEVDFTQPYAEWPLLFRHLLPSHLTEAGGENFSNELSGGIPASAGRYLVDGVDSARGVITLHRNDRFWGEDPARTDILRLIEVRDPDLAADLVRSGQVSFLDIVPAETTVQALELLPTAQVRDVQGQRQLDIVLSTTSPALGEHQRRREFLGYLDHEILVRQAAGRSADVTPAEFDSDIPAPDDYLLPQLTAARPLRVGVDPADRAATAAARTTVDLLAAHGVSAQVVPAALEDIAGSGLIEQEIDAVVAWSHREASASAAASTLICPPVRTTRLPAGEQAATELFRTANLSGYCTPETDELLYSGLSGEVDAATVRQTVEDISAFEHLRMPLLVERRVAVLGEGMVGPSPVFEEWPAGLATAAQWRRVP